MSNFKMLKLLISLLGFVGMTMATSCSVDQSALITATTNIMNTVSMLPNTIMAGNCMINIMYNDTMHQAMATINGSIIFNLTFPISGPNIPPVNPQASPQVNPQASPQGNPEGSPQANPQSNPQTNPPTKSSAAGSSKRKRETKNGGDPAIPPPPPPPAYPVPMPMSCMLWIINPISCQAYQWTSITSMVMGTTYINSIHEGAVLFGLSPPMSDMNMFGPYMLMQPVVMNVKATPNMQTKTTPVNSANVFIFQKGFPEKTMMGGLTTGNSTATQISLTGNIALLNITSSAPKA